jgi:effector-binding domain-containing protein
MSNITLKKVDSMYVASVRAVIADMALIGQTFRQLFGLLSGYVPPDQRASAPMILYHDTDDGDLPVEVVFPLRDRLSGTADIAIYELSGAEMACLTHQGSFDGIGKAYQQIFLWIETNHYRHLSPSREIYQVFNPAHPEYNVTEIQIPISPDNKQSE